MYFVMYNSKKFGIFFICKGPDHPHIIGPNYLVLLSNFRHHGSTEAVKKNLKSFFVCKGPDHPHIIGPNYLVLLSNLVTWRIPDCNFWHGRQVIFSLINALVYVDIWSGYSLGQAAAGNGHSQTMTSILQTNYGY